MTNWFQSSQEEKFDHHEEAQEIKDWRERPSQPAAKKLKQMEFDFRGILCTKQVEKKVEEKRDTKDEAAEETPPPLVAREDTLVEEPKYVKKTGKITKKESKKLAQKCY